MDCVCVDYFFVECLGFIVVEREEILFDGIMLFFFDSFFKILVRK